MAEFQERIVGFEMEYSPTVITQKTPESSRSVERVEVTSQIQATGFSDDAGFMDDGFKVYTDCEMTEVCTPETTPDKVGTLQLISENMLIDGLKRFMEEDEMDKYSGEPPYRSNYFLPLRVADDYRTSGFHENYQPLGGELVSITKFLERFSATVGCWTGQGCVISGSGDFLTTQKAGLKTEGSGAIVSLSGTLPEGIKGEENIRYELRYNNYPTLYWQLQNRAAYTSAVIRALEAGALPYDAASDIGTTQGMDIHSVSVEVARNPHAHVTGVDGKLSAIDIQLSLAESVVDIAKKLSFPDYELQSAVDVASVLASLKDFDYDRVATAVPWVMKRLMLDKKIEAYAEDRAPDVNDTNKARKICLVTDSRGFEGALDIIRARTREYYPEYEYASILGAQLGKTHRADVAIRRGRSVERYSPMRPEINVRHNWMTQKVITTSR
jgi:hypothetical protein